MTDSDGTGPDSTRSDSTGSDSTGSDSSGPDRPRIEGSTADGSPDEVLTGEVLTGEGRASEGPGVADAGGTGVWRELPEPDDTAALGRELAAVLRAGDVVLLTGELGAGKTTLTAGLGAGLGVRGPITSPTFVIARVHPSLVGGPALVHADAYRLGGALELEELDLDASLDEAVTVVEWGRGLAEGLADSYLEVELARAVADDDEQPRRARVIGHGPRWRSARQG